MCYGTTCFIEQIVIGSDSMGERADAQAGKILSDPPAYHPCVWVGGGSTTPIENPATYQISTLLI
jgi:hypothetical protein